MNKKQIRKKIIRRLNELEKLVDIGIFDKEEPEKAISEDTWYSTICIKPESFEQFLSMIKHMKISDSWFMYNNDDLSMEIEGDHAVIKYDSGGAEKWVLFKCKYSIVSDIPVAIVLTKDKATSDNIYLIRDTADNTQIYPTDLYSGVQAAISNDLYINIIKNKNNGDRDDLPF